MTGLLCRIRAGSKRGQVRLPGRPGRYLCSRTGRAMRTGVQSPCSEDVLRHPARLGSEPVSLFGWDLGCLTAGRTTRLSAAYFRSRVKVCGFCSSRESSRDESQFAASSRGPASGLLRFGRFGQRCVSHAPFPHTPVLRAGLCGAWSRIFVPCSLRPRFVQPLRA